VGTYPHNWGIDELVANWLVEVLVVTDALWLPSDGSTAREVETTRTPQNEIVAKYSGRWTPSTSTSTSTSTLVPVPGGGALRAFGDTFIFKQSS
jgi:hypothetical protein